MTVRIRVFNWIVFISLLAFAPISFANQKSLVVLGDSLTEGYGVSRDSAFPTLLQNKIATANLNWKVINSGNSGSTSASAPARMDWILKQKPDLIILALGANDGLRGLPVAAMEKNLQEAIKKAKLKNVKVILAGMKMPPNYGKAYTKSFENTFAKVAKQQGVPLIPFLLEGVAGEKSLNLSDGIHPNEKGHQVIADHLWTFLQGELK